MTIRDILNRVGDDGLVLPDEYPAVAGPTLTLNVEQESAVDAPLDVSAVRVMAGAGAGKTRVMGARVLRMIDWGVPIDKIRAVTLTRKMADEMFRRIIQYRPALEHTELANQVCTIHAMCRRFLVKLDQPVGRIPPDWSIRQKFQALAGKYKLDGLTNKLAYPNVLSEWVSRSKMDGLSVEESRMYFHSNIRDTSTANAVWHVRAEFDDWLQSRREMTHDDMLLDLELLLRKPWARSVLSGYYVVADEGQDVTNQALRILSRLTTGGQFYIIGDLDQTLFRFAGASPDANLGPGFDERFPGGLTYMLSTNYRSTRAIVDGALNVIKHNYTEDTMHLMKPLHVPAGKLYGIKPEYMVYDDPQLEAAGVIGSIMKQVAEEGRSYGDFYIGSRIRALLAYYERLLLQLGVPYVNYSGSSFWKLKHIQLLCSYLGIVVDPGSTKYFNAIYNVSSRWMRQPFDLRDSEGNVTKPEGAYCSHRWLGKGKRFIRKFPSYNGVPEYSWGSRVEYKWQEGVDDLVMTVSQIQKIYQEHGFVDAMRWIVDNIVTQWWREENGVANVTEQIEDDFAVVYDIADGYDTAGEFLDFVAKIESAVEHNDDEEVVVLSTVHKLKGRERPVMYLIGAADGILPIKFALVTDGSPRDSTILEPPPNQTLIEDERCIFYVGLTRAQERVYVSAPLSWRGKSVSPSRFIDELKTKEEDDVTAV